MPDNPDLCQVALIAIGVPRSLSLKTVDRSTSTTSFNIENFKKSVNTLLFVSTLVATVAFATAFTVPGGYDSSSTHSGIATMLRDKGFHIFVFCDSIAMYSSIIAAVAFIWAQLGDFTLLLDALNLALPFLGAAFFTMSMTFTAGLFLAVIILIPLCTPITPSNRIYRYISYHVIHLAILATYN
ncbi:hypothetical protein CDL12_02164 [Handroanthus impetiginosus]|uniref:PGG domain-containing protein n=1 Tax=Handroanthus impetiginosus TaxID=429701 RepID=A0A2G9I5S0_9LAMI|nr:hypothetical protein CDL12_02164 [Handroanthus impetiginosus]